MLWFVLSRKNCRTESWSSHRVLPDSLSRRAGWDSQGAWVPVECRQLQGLLPLPERAAAWGGGSRHLSRRWFLCRSMSAACGGQGLVTAGAEGPWGLVCRAPFLSARSPEVPPLCSCLWWISSSCNISLSSSLSEHFDLLRYLLELRTMMSSHSSAHPSEMHLCSLSYVTTQCKEITDPLICVYSDNSEQEKLYIIINAGPG